MFEYMLHLKASIFKSLVVSGKKIAHSIFTTMPKSVAGYKPLLGR